MKKLILLTGIVLGVSACGSVEQKQEESKTVKVIEVKKYDNESTRSYTFISQPYRVSELSFRVGGPVNVFDVQNGQFFRKGQLIAAIDDRDFIIREKRAEAAFVQAEADFKRIAALYEKDNISASNYEKARANFEKAEADYNDARNALNDTKLYAPFDGYVQKTFIEKFSDVKPSMPVVTFIDLSKIKAEAYVTEDMATSMRKKNDSNISISFGAIKGKSFKPSETFISQNASDNNISYQITAIIDNKDNSLMGGMTGSLNILYKSPISSSSITSKTLVIPQSAVCNNNTQGEYVWKIDEENNVRLTQVKTGRLVSGNRIEILAGLDEGEKIAITRLQQLSDNEKIIITE